MSTTCVYRFLGSMPPPGFPLLVDADELPGETPPRVMGQIIRKRVSHDQRSVLKDRATIDALKQRLEEGHTLRELNAWAEKDTTIGSSDKTKIIKTISVARKLNDKSLLRSVLLPCQKALFLGIVTDRQPSPPQGSAHGLNHARVVVEGRVGTLRTMFTDPQPGITETEPKRLFYDSPVLNGSIKVLGKEVGIIVDGQRILTTSGIELDMQTHPEA